MKTLLTADQIMGLDSSHLEVIPNNDGYLLENQTLLAFSEMQSAAFDDGIDVQICSAHRSFDKQLSIWNRKWFGKLPILDADSKQINIDSLSDSEKVHAIMRWSALPGASRHHWGTDFDVYDKQSVYKSAQAFELIPQEYEKNGPCYELNLWLKKHAKRFGFYRPYAQYQGGVSVEPWHYSFQPISDSIIEMYDLAQLSKVLNDSELAGKSIVIPILSELFERYTLNKRS